MDSQIFHHKFDNDHSIKKTVYFKSDNKVMSSSPALFFILLHRFHLYLN